MNTRIALTIGNSNYQNEDSVSGIKDADLMAKELALIGFDVLPPVLDGTLDKMNLENGALKDLNAKIANASVVVFFFSGHGFQRAGENYLMPIDGTTSAESSLSLTEVKKALSSAPQEAIKLVILDACRPETTPGLDPALAPRLKNTLYAFAAGAGGSTPAGKPDEFSPFSAAILNHLLEPGLGIGELFDKVGADLALGTTPAILNADVPTTFAIRDPVFIQAQVLKADDDLLMLLHGDVVLTASKSPQEQLQLKGGDNPFTLMVSNGKTYRNNHDWSLTEGWNYEVSLGQVGASSTFPGVSLKETGEDFPFKDGPHHGKVFVAARGNLFVDQTTQPPAVEVRGLDTKVWQEDAPSYAQQPQGFLYEKSIVDLPIDLDQVISEAFNLGQFSFLAPAIRTLLQSGDFLGLPVADPSKIFVLVVGNTQDPVYRDLVNFCMTDQLQDRVGDLKASLEAVLARKDRPFDTFDQNLMAAIQLEATKRGIPNPKNIRVWTALDDRSKP